MKTDAGDKKAPSALSIGLWACLALEACLLAILLFVPFGWDHPRGPLNLDADDLALCFISYVAIVLTGTILAGLTKSWILLADQILVPIAIALAIYFGFIRM
jgi:hypothetical protein